MCSMRLQTLHDGPVIRLRGQPASGCEDLAVLYPQVLVVIDGFGLVQTLRACVGRLSRGFDLSPEHCPVRLASDSSFLS